MGAEILAPFAMWGAIAALLGGVVWAILRSARKRGQVEGELDAAKDTTRSLEEQAARMARPRVTHRAWLAHARDRVRLHNDDT